MKKHFTDEQIIGFLKQADEGVPGEGIVPTDRMPSDYEIWKQRMLSSRGC